MKSWIAHALLTTTVNVGASTIDSRSVLEGENEFWTPKGLFYNEDALSLVFDRLSSSVRCLPQEYLLRTVILIRQFTGP